MASKWPIHSLWIVFVLLFLLFVAEVVLFHTSWHGGKPITEAPSDVEALKTVLEFNSWQTGLVLGLFAAFSFLIRREGLKLSTAAFVVEALTLLFLGFAFLFGVLIYYEVEYMLTSNAVNADYEYFSQVRVAQKLLFGAGLVLFGMNVVRDRYVGSGKTD